VGETPLLGTISSSLLSNASSRYVPSHWCGYESWEQLCQVRWS